MPILPRVSVGCTEFDTALKNINDAVKEADDKMYTAKKRARETADPLRKNLNNNSDYLQKARKYGHFTGYKN